MAIAPVTSIRPVARTDSPAKKGVGDGIGARQEQKAEELGFFDKVSNFFTTFGGMALQKGKPAKQDNRTLHMEVYKEMDMQDEARRSAEQARATSTSTRSLTGEEWRQRYQPAYTVQSGDNLSKIARENNTTVEALLEVNPSITNPNQISVSQVITLPFSDAAVVRPTPAGLMSPTPTGTLPATGGNASSSITDQGLMARDRNEPPEPLLSDSVVSEAIRNTTSDTSMQKKDIVKQVRDLVGTNIRAAGILGAFTKESGANFDNLEESSAYSLAGAYNAWTDSDVDRVLLTLPRDVQARLKADYRADTRTGGQATTEDRQLLGSAMFDAKYRGGSAYKGRGLIHITHVENYRAVGERIGVDLVSNPELVNDPRYALPAALAYLELKGYFKKSTNITQQSLQRMINPAASRDISISRWNSAQAFLRDWQAQAAPQVSIRPQAKPTQE